MAKMRGTGKDPVGRYREGTTFDVPDGSQEEKELVDRGWAEYVGDAAKLRDDFQIANAVVRNDPLIHPIEAEMAAKVEDRAHDIVHSGDPKAKKGEVQERAAKRAEDNASAVRGGQLAHDTPTHWDAGAGFDGQPEGGGRVAPAAGSEASKESGSTKSSSK